MWWRRWWRVRPSATFGDHVGIITAAVPDLSAPQCAPHVGGSGAPLFGLQEVDERWEPGQRAEIEGHVGHHVLDVAAHAVWAHRNDMGGLQRRAKSESAATGPGFSSISSQEKAC